MAQEVELISAHTIGVLKERVNQFFVGKAATLVVQSFTVIARDLARFTGIEYRVEIVYDETAGTELADKFTVESFEAPNLPALQQLVNDGIAAAPAELWFPLPLQVVDTIRRLSFNLSLFLRNPSAAAAANLEPASNPPAKVTTITDADSPYAASVGEMVYADTTAGPITVALPPAAQFGGDSVTVLRTSGGVNNVTLDPDGAETINGAASDTLAAQYASITAISDGTELFIRSEI